MNTTYAQVGTIKTMDVVGERRTMEVRMNDLAKRTIELKATTKNIHHVLFGPSKEDDGDDREHAHSMDSILSDIERNVRETAAVLDEIESGLTNAKQVKGTYEAFGKIR